jgi:hypothetical protein
MWALSLAIFAGFKWLTYRRGQVRGQAPPARRVAGYFLAWPGMDAGSFFGSKPGDRPRRSEWAAAFARMFLGVFLVWLAARAVFPFAPEIAGWTGMTGVVFILHFGLFDSLSLAWRRAGVDAQPLMQNPLSSRYLSEFWSRRWNTAFHALALHYALRPLRRVLPAPAAMMAVFIVSGLVHDAVISLPARGGYGLPTVYFAIQGLGVLAERSKPGRKAGLGGGPRGRAFALMVAAIPAPLLFHRLFIHDVILPMLKAMGAI